MAESLSTNCRLVLLPSGRRGEITAGTNLLAAAQQLGVELESICGGRQTCGRCQVALEEGNFAKHGIRSMISHLSPIEDRELDYWEKKGSNGRRLACAARVLGDVLIVVPEESQACKQIIAKAATERVIDVRPAVRQVYVECEPARLDDPHGDWERLQEALAQQWELRNLAIDPFALRTLQPALREGKNAVTLSIWQDSEVLRIQPGYAEGVYGLAIDVGSTTVVAHLSDLRTGALLATEAMMNPQVRYGEDLMSRISYGMMHPDGAERLHQAIVEALNTLIERSARAAGIDPQSILDVVLVGNTVMHHLLLGIDPVELGGAPFALAVSGPLDLKARDLGITTTYAAARVHILPCIAGQNGADNMAVLLAEAPHLQDEMTLVVDIGTNAEILLGNRQQVSAASSPTGPAFEGAQITHGQRAAAGAIERVRIDPENLEVKFKIIGRDEWIEPSMQAQATGLCGSGIIEAVAEMFLSGIIDNDGRFLESSAGRGSGVRFHGRSGEFVLACAHQTSTGNPIVVTQNDVRAIQLAKAALYAGVKLLMQRCGVLKIDRILLAGAFGNYISPWHAMVLGLIPDCELSRVIAVGNAAGDGARIALLDRERRAEAAHLARQVDYASIAVEPRFQEEFVAAMALPHARDSFSHLASALPSRQLPDRRDRKRRRVS
ncbi:MAG: ASKHA domain-containing protein [Acidobacteria bacterium]|nr:ASKHA domain-containing protein [Acidobacteriota bacterium]